MVITEQAHSSHRQSLGIQKLKKVENHGFQVWHTSVLVLGKVEECMHRVKTNTATWCEWDRRVGP